MRFSSEKNLEKVVELVAQVSASERPRKLAGQCDKVTVTGGAGIVLSCFCLLGAYFSLMKSVYRGQRALNTSARVSVSFFRVSKGKHSLQANLKTGRQI